ncbi:C-factor-like isoform X1 [Schistocerca serialis cubense]|uniref:C-factor-like isoform X1 n=1 Tax=Schistocerca serialis cubense TaxID=2023355 RepID=UPI00214F3A4B|nr:C-factor-like isoform X1 [Schistocerca serialis cubense]
MRSVLITGCSRGIGLELVKQLTGHKSAPEFIIATCRKPEEARALQELSKKHKSIHVLKLDVTDFSSLGGFAKDVEGIVGDEGLNLLINNAGISGNKTAKLADLKAEELAEIYKTNTIAPILLTQALVPLLRKAASHNASAQLGIGKAAIVNISSSLGSVSRNTFGGYYGYRESKAALNTSTRSISHELATDGILVMTLHPGWVKTDMGGKEADLTVEFSAAEIVKTLFKLGKEHQGAFLQYDGSVLPW